MHNILFYETSSGFGGSANALTNIVNYLNIKKYLPIVAISNYGEKIEKMKDAQILKVKANQEPERLSNLRFFLYVLKHYIPEAVKLYFVLNKTRISLVHINTNITSGIPAIIASKMAGIPCVCHIRETRRLIKREKIFAKLIDKLIILNNNAYDIYKRDVSEDKIKVAYDGIDLEEFKQINPEVFKKEYNLDSMPLVGTAGRIVEGKGQREFILAAQEVLRGKPGISFVIAGDTKAVADKYYREVKESALNSAFYKNMVFTGWRSDIRNIISALNIFVFTSTTYAEGLPNSIIEAMALSKPVVATNIAGPSDIVVDGKTGFLVPPGDIKAMADKITYLLDNPDIARKMGEEGRRRAEELFDIKKQIKKIEAIYEEVLTDKS